MPPPRPVMERSPRRGGHWYRSPVRLSRGMLDLCQQVSDCRRCPSTCKPPSSQPAVYSKNSPVELIASDQYVQMPSHCSRLSSCHRCPSSIQLSASPRRSVIAANCVLRPRRRRRTRPWRRRNSRCGCRSRCRRRSWRCSGCWSWCRSRCRCGSDGARQGINVSPATTRPD